MKRLVSVLEKYSLHAFLAGIAILLASVGVVALSANTRPGVTASEDLSAPIATSRQLAAKVNIAGRQRMLTQRMVKAACFMASNIAVNSHRAQLIRAQDNFAQALRNLRDGSALLNLPAETSPEVLVAMIQIEPVWDTLAREVDAILLDNVIEPDSLRSLNTRAEQVLQAADAATYQAAQNYDRSGEDLPLALTLVVDIAGRQRMLIERSVKNACLMRQSQRPALYQRDLAQTMTLFDTTLTTLRFGNEDLNIPRATDPTLAQQLAVVAKSWPAVKRTLDKAAGGQALNDTELATLARRANTLLDEVDRVVKTFEGLRRL